MNASEAGRALQARRRRRYRLTDEDREKAVDAWRSYWERLSEKDKRAYMNRAFAAQPRNRKPQAQRSS